MGAPKQKWTSEEEGALKAGVAKYGVGKWSTILKDPEFAVVLRSRSNVDLKDKWRNLHVMASGWGSRQRGRVVSKSVQPTSKNDDNTLVSSVGENGIEVLDTKPLASSGDVLKDVGSKKPLSSGCKLDDLILEAIVKLKEPRGSSRNAISSYIEERFMETPNFERLLASKLKSLTEKGRLIKVKHQYRIAPSRVSSDAKGGPLSLLMGRKHDSSMVEKNEISIQTKAQVDADLEQMKSMSEEEAAAAAAQFVAEAEVAIAEAERAARIAEEYEKEAEAAQCFAEVAMKALQHQTIPV
ncbi:telomere repeat-binding factor 1-like [Lycium ferocissimum]|uniref:telomere repeat-binding factor 1-like n=1 Tax=Lycium ferocissimum TaxID=112874 RepID=UPI0028166419|nr:telomere repeat-binding factor 1-like [Lycium ferocissimum]XP_059282822.1 telomere repeat-binding factor 1-like [Lycium ferocissimum]